MALKYSRGALYVFVAFSLLSCASIPLASRSPILFPRATITREQVESAIQFEETLAKRYDVDAPEGAPWFEVLSGDAPIVVSAPHATTPTRAEAERKFADGGTGALAVAIHRLTGATVIYTTYKSPSDPNFYDDNAYKNALAEMIASRKPMLVLDLHASHWTRPYDVDFGTMGGASLLGNVSILESLAEHLRVAGLTNFSQDYFAASKNATVTKFVTARGVPCIQLEINSTRTSAGSSKLDAHRFAQLLEGLTRFIREVAPSDDGK